MPRRHCGSCLGQEDAPMLINTKILFSAILREFKPECVCDIGSRDGAQSILFRNLLPKARVIAFEANPFNYKAMQADKRLAECKVEILQCAISDKNGSATFHVSDVDYSNPDENRGTSSLLHHSGVPVRESVEVETRRIDDFILNQTPSPASVALWIDVEGAEALVLGGIDKIQDRIQAIHVEVATHSVWEGQKPAAELIAELASRGFTVCGSNLEDDRFLGDIVLISDKAKAALGSHLWFCRLKAAFGHWLQADIVADRLKRKAPLLYRVLRKAYIRLAT